MLLARDPYLVLKGASLSAFKHIQDPELAVEAIAVIHSLSRRRDRSLLGCQRSEGELVSTLAALEHALPSGSSDLAVGTLANALIEDTVSFDLFHESLGFLVDHSTGSAPVRRQVVRSLANLSADGLPLR